MLHKKKTEKITLKEEDIAKLRYETVYLSELQSKRKLTFNVFIKHFKRKDFSKISVSPSRDMPECSQSQDVCDDCRIEMSSSLDEETTPKKTFTHSCTKMS